jgi:hypothetical protein
MQRVKICPTCREEFVAEAQQCPDCGATLVWPSRLDELPPADLDAAVDWDRFPPGEILGQVAGGSERVVGTYVALLAAEGVRCAVLPVTRYVPRGMTRRPSVFYGVFLSAGGGKQVPVSDGIEGFEYQLFVRREDTGRAEEIIGRVFARLHPGREEGLSVEFAAGRCPACGAAVPDEAAACPDCGLVFG